MTRLGIISDTHGLLRPEAVTALQGSDTIVHAGDVGNEDILPALRDIAPVYAVRGNVDKGAWAQALPLTEAFEVEESAIYVYHGHLPIKLDPAAGGFNVVISGHSHQPLVEQRGSVLYVNPGSAGRKRFKLPVSLARLTVVGKDAEAELIYLEV